MSSVSQLIDRLLSSNSSLILSDDGTDQTFLGNLGQLIIEPSAGLVLSTNLAQGDKISAFEFRDLVGNGAGADRDLGFYFRMLNREGLGAFDPDEAVLSLTAEQNPTLILYATGIGGGTEAGYMDKSGFGFATSVDADGLPDKSSSGPRLKFVSSGTQNLLSSSTLVTKFLIGGGRQTGSTIEFSLSGNSIQDQQIIFRVGSSGVESADSTKSYFLFTSPHRFNDSSTQNYLEMEWDDAGNVLRTRMAIDRNNLFGLADQSDLAFLVFQKYDSSTTITANRTLTYDLVNADRTVKIQGNPTLDDWFDQTVKITASPTFAGLTLTGNIVMADNSITGIDTLTFTDVNGTIAGIQNQNLVDKSVDETITGDWTHSGFLDATSGIGTGYGTPIGLVDGVIAGDSGQQEFDCHTAGVNGWMRRTIFVSSASTTVANTVTETTIIGSGLGTLTLPAAFFVVGKTVRVKVMGIYSTTGTPTLQVRVKLGSTVVLDSTAIATASGVTNELFEITGEITCRSTGVSGTVFSQALNIRTTGSTGSHAIKMVNTSTVTINTTISQAVDVTAEWGTASASNTITGTNFTLEVLA